MLPFTLICLFPPYVLCSLINDSQWRGEIWIHWTLILSQTDVIISGQTLRFILLNWVSEYGVTFTRDIKLLPKLDIRVRGIFFVRKWAIFDKSRRITFIYDIILILAMVHVNAIRDIDPWSRIASTCLPLAFIFFGYSGGLFGEVIEVRSVDGRPDNCETNEEACKAHGYVPE